MAGESTSLLIERLEKGDSTRTALHADVMNEIIDAINIILLMTVSPQGAGKFIWSDGNAVLQIKSSFEFPDPDDTEKTYVWFAEFVDPAWVFSWRETTECECNTIDGGSA